MEGCHLSIEEKGIVIEMSRSRMSQHSIAIKLGMAHTTIEYVLKKFQDYRTLVTHKAIRQCCKLIE